MRNTTNFLIVLLEWYEFTVYNALIPYGIFGGYSNVLQYGFSLGALSFLARPIGAVYFSSLNNKTQALKRGLGLMSISTILMGVYPQIIPRPIWFGICKILQGFAIGGSYGLAYLSVYEKEQAKKNPKTNYKLSVVQTGWVYGMLLGQFTVLVFKILFGNLGATLALLKTGNYYGITKLHPTVEFISFGWRFIFLLSGFFGVILYLHCGRTPINSAKDDLQNDTLKTESIRTNIISNIYKYLRQNPARFLSIFWVIALEMILFHSWFTYHEASVEVSKKILASSITNNLRLILLLINFPIMGHITDRLNQAFNGNGNRIMLTLTCLSMITFSIFRPDPISWIIVSSITASMCYGSILGWSITAFGKDASSLLGPTFNLAGALIGGTVPLVSSLIPHPNYLTIGLTTISMISLFTIR